MDKARKVLLQPKHACCASPPKSCCCSLRPGLTLPYPQHKFAAEFAIQWLFLLVEPARLFLGEQHTVLHGSTASACGADMGAVCALHPFLATASAVPAAVCTSACSGATRSFPSYKPNHVSTQALGQQQLQQSSVPHAKFDGFHSCPQLTVRGSNLIAVAAPAGDKGNKTEQSAPLLFSVLLSLPMIVFFVYYLQFQTYV